MVFMATGPARKLLWAWHSTHDPPRNLVADQRPKNLGSFALQIHTQNW